MTPTPRLRCTLGRTFGNKNVEQCHCTFSNLVLCESFHKAVRFIYKWKSGGRGGVLPEEMATYKTVFMKETAEMVLEKIYQHEKTLFYVGGV